MKILRSAQLVERVGLSRTQIWRLERAGRFPKRIQIGLNSVGWIEHEVDGWIEARAEERNTSVAEAK